MKKHILTKERIARARVILFKYEGRRIDYGSSNQNDNPDCWDYKFLNKFEELKGKNKCEMRKYLDERLKEYDLYGEQGTSIKEYKKKLWKIIMKK